MSDADLWAAWRHWMVVATVVVLLAAGLLITILVTARRILAEAVRALNAVEAIRRQHAADLGAAGRPTRWPSRSCIRWKPSKQKGGALVAALEGEAAKRP